MDGRPRWFRLAARYRTSSTLKEQKVCGREFGICLNSRIVAMKTEDIVSSNLTRIVQIYHVLSGDMVLINPCV